MIKLNQLLLSFSMLCVIFLRNGWKKSLKNIHCFNLLQEDEVRFVKVRGENVPIKTVLLSDETATKVKVTLWHDLSSAETRPGEFVKITDLITSTYQSEISLSATTNSTVEVFIHLFIVYLTMW